VKADARVAGDQAGWLTGMPARAAAAGAGKTVRFMSRALGRGGGTTLPGHVAGRIDPGLVASLAAGLPNGCVLVTGTNGKTTTTRVLAAAARAAGLEVITNPEGSNMLSGVATALLVHTNGLGVLDVPASAIGIFEVDEGALPAAIETLSPRLVVITNLFRDQLDRYFEVDFVAKLWENAMSGLPATTTVVLNADDPQVAHLGDGVEAKVVHFGLEDRQWARPVLEHAADSRRCPKCSHDLLYDLSFYAHLGHYACRECGWRRPRRPAKERSGCRCPGCTTPATRWPPRPRRPAWAWSRIWSRRPPKAPSVRSEDSKRSASAPSRPSWCW
jgi:UDP-N-acetylmuramyl tripeptide synthase